MKHKELIESGKLELYALGALDLQDKKEIETLLQNDEELKAEYHAIAEALGVYGKSASEMPAMEILERAKMQIAEDTKGESVTDAQIIAMNPTKSGFTKWWAAAASIMLVASIGLNLKLNSDLTQKQEDLVALQSENQLMAANTVRLDADVAQTNDLIASIASGSMDRTYMGSTENYNGYESAVYWDKDTKEVILATNKLPSLSEAEQYQLWAIVDGKPVDVGVFDATTTFAQMKDVNGDAVAFAVTIEPKGGSVNPTMEKMVMLGNVAS